MVHRLLEHDMASKIVNRLDIEPTFSASTVESSALTPTAVSPSAQDGIHVDNALFLPSSFLVLPPNWVRRGAVKVGPRT